MTPLRRTVSVLLAGAAVAAFLSAQCTEAQCLSSPISVGNPHAAVARKLVAGNVWGVVSTISLHLNGAPWGCGALVSPRTDCVRPVVEAAIAEHGTAIHIALVPGMIT